jgi:hypothetical protein
VLAISVSVAYAITVAMAVAASTSNAPTTISVAWAPGQSAVTARSVTAQVEVDGVGSSEVCNTTGGRMVYVGLNSWIPAESGAARCTDGTP